MEQNNQFVGPDFFKDEFDKFNEFNEFDEFKDVGLVANSNNESDLHAQSKQDLPGESGLSSHSEASVMFYFGDGVSEAAEFLFSDQEFFFSDSFSGLGGDADAAVPAAQSGLSSPHPTPIQINSSNLDFTNDVGSAGALSTPTPSCTIAPDEAVSYSRPGTQVPNALSAYQGKQWQVSVNEHTQLYQPQPQSAFVPLLQFGDQLDSDLRTPTESPSQEQAWPAYETQFATPSKYEVAPNLPQTQDYPQQRSALSLEQIQLLQNVEPATYPTPSTRKRSLDTARESNLSSTASSEENDRSRKTFRRTKAVPKHAAQATYRALAPRGTLTFNSLQNAEAAMGIRLLESNWRAPSPDNTVPTTQEDRSSYVFMMFEAFQDTSLCKDNKTGHSFRKRWESGNYYDLRAMEKVCWHMLDIAERLHSQGPTSTNIYCEEALKKLKVSRDLTFEQRIHATCAMLRFSKNLCDNLLKGEGIEALIGAPKQKMSGAKTMMIQNQRRQKWIVHGRKEAQQQANPPGSASRNADNNEAAGSIKPTAKQSKRSGRAAKPRAKTETAPIKVSDKCSDEQGQPDYLLRRSSINSLRRRSSMYETGTSKKRKRTADEESLPENNPTQTKRAKATKNTEAKSVSVEKNGKSKEQPSCIVTRSRVTRSTAASSSERSDTSEGSFLTQTRLRPRK